MISANEARSNICEFKNEREKKLVKLERESTLLVDNEIKNAMEKINAAIKKESLENGQTYCHICWPDFSNKLTNLGCTTYSSKNVDPRETIKNYDIMFDNKLTKLLNELGYDVRIKDNDRMKLENGKYVWCRFIIVKWEKKPPVLAVKEDTPPPPPPPSIPVAEEIKEKNCIIC